MLEAMGASNRVFIPDLDLLNQFYGKIGHYLHSQKEPMQTVDRPDWWKEFLNLIEDTYNYISSIGGNDFGSYDLNEHGLDIFRRWQSGEISRAQTLEILRTDFTRS